MKKIVFCLAVFLTIGMASNDSSAFYPDWDEYFLNNQDNWFCPEGFIFGAGSIVLVRLRFDNDAINAYNYVPDGLFYNPLALEIDLVEHCEGSCSELEVVKIESPNLPSEAQWIKDTLLSDNYTDADDRHTLGSLFIHNPGVLEAGVDYIVYFYFNQSFPENGILVHLNQQITTDAYSVDEFFDRFYPWSNISTWIERFTHFSVATEAVVPFRMSFSQLDGACWNDRETSYNCNYIGQGGGSENIEVTDGVTVSLDEIYLGTESYLQDIIGDDPGDTGTTLDGPDGNVKKVEIDNTGNNWHHSYTASPGQDLEIRVKVTNKGDETIDYFEVFIFRFDDLNFDKDEDRSYGREEEEDDLNPGEGTYKHRSITAPSTPGIYYFYAYINRVDGEEGDDDQDWSNNYSRNDDPEESGGDPLDNYTNSPCGKAGFTKEKCISIFNTIFSN